MNSVVTFIVKPSDRLFETVRTKAVSFLGSQYGTLSENILAPSKALDITFSCNDRTGLSASLVRHMAGLPVDIAVQSVEGRRKKLLLADMDSTMITIECVDELADYAGVKEKVAAITEAAMQGELDFTQSLQKRVALLEGLDESVLLRCYNERVEATSGARSLIQTMAANGAYTKLVSGGFTFFTERVAALLGFHGHRANVLGIKSGRLTGTILGSIVSGETKRQTLLDLIKHHGFEVSDTMAVGDGANDIPMLETAGLGIAYHAKPKTENAAAISIRHTNLQTLLFIQGYHQDEIIED